MWGRLDWKGCLLNENIEFDQQIIDEAVAHLNVVNTDFSYTMEKNMEVDA